MNAIMPPGFFSTLSEFFVFRIVDDPGFRRPMLSLVSNLFRATIRRSFFALLFDQPIATTTRETMKQWQRAFHTRCNNNTRNAMGFLLAAGSRVSYRSRRKPRAFDFSQSPKR